MTKNGKTILRNEKVMFERKYLELLRNVTYKYAKKKLILLI